MNNLTEVCDNEAATSLSDLHGCIDYGHVLSFNWTEGIVLIVAAVAGAVLAPIARKNAIAILDGLFLCPLAVFGAMTGGLLLAQWIHPYIMGVWLIFCALAGGFFLIRGLVVGGGKAGWKALGAILLLGFMAVYAWLGAWCFSVPSEAARDEYARYLSSMTWLFAATGFFGAFMAAAYGAYHGAVGWLLAFINGSWGAIGTLMAAMHHVSSWFMFDKHGQPHDGDRKFYFCYEDGMRFRAGSAFTLGDVMTGPPVEKHESHHALQHFIFGPIMTISYLLWMVPGLIVGLIFGPAKGRDVAKGIEACAYYNNPWEVWSYAVEGGRSQNGDTTLIWGNGLSWSLTISYILLSAVLYPLIIVLLL